MKFSSHKSGFPVVALDGTRYSKEIRVLSAKQFKVVSESARKQPSWKKAAEVAPMLSTAARQVAGSSVRNPILGFANLVNMISDNFMISDKEMAF